MKQYKETHSNHTGAAPALTEGQVIYLPLKSPNFTPIFLGISNNKL